MNATEAGELVALMALYDNRKVSDPDIVAWLKVIGDLDYADSETAVLSHYQESRERIMPADVRIRVKAMRRDRLARELIDAPPPEVTDKPGRYKAVLDAEIRKIADGRSIERAIGELSSAPPPSVAGVRKELGPAIPPAERLLPPEEIARRQAAESRAARGASVNAEPEEGEPGGMSHICEPARIAYDCGIDPIDYAEDELTVLIGVHLGLASVLADLGVNAPEGTLTTGAMSRRILGSLMDAGWTPPEVTG